MLLPLPETTVTDAVAAMSPPGPVHVRVKSLSRVNAPVDALPDVAWEPDQAPDAEQLVAFVLLHVRVADCPLETLAGLTLRDSVGAGAALFTVTVTELEAFPPAPWQVSE